MILLLRALAVGALVSSALVAPAAAARPAAARGGGSWLREANYLRSFWNVPVPTLTEDPQLSAKDAAHDHYLDENNTCGHTEDPGNPYYTAAGAYAGENSVVYCGAMGPVRDVDGWVGTPLHGEQVLNPQLTETGFAETHLHGGHAAMDTLTHYADGPAPTEPATWPNGDGFPLTRYSGGEIDYTGGDAVADNCPAQYTAHEDRLGTPLFVDLPGGAHDATPAHAHDVWLRDRDGTSLPFCTYDSTSGVAPFLSTAVLLPLHPLRAGMHYNASFTAGGQTATWSFTVAAHRSALAISAPAVTRYGTRAVVSATLRDTTAGRRLAGRPVQLFRRPAGSHGAWESAGTHDTDGAGQVRIAVTPSHATEYRWRYAGGLEHAAASSHVRTLSVAMRVTAHVADKAVRAGHPVVVAGSVAPDAAGLRVRVQVRRQHTWRFTDRDAIVSPHGTYRVEIRLRRAGDHALRIRRAATLVTRPDTPERSTSWSGSANCRRLRYERRVTGGLYIHRAERADPLVAALGGILAAPLADPFAPEVVAVPSRGVERWLAQQLSHVLGAADGDGVCANVLFPPSSRLLDDAVGGR